MQPILVLAALLTAGAAETKAAKPISIYVGPMVRDGFVDVDQGVLDSIKDITEELRKTGVFTIAPNETAASLKLHVVSRAKVTSGGSVGVSTGTAAGTQATGMTVTVPLEVLRLETLLRVASYERGFTGESDASWKRSAGSIVKDLRVWVTANRDRIP